MPTYQVTIRFEVRDSERYPADVPRWARRAAEIAARALGRASYVQSATVAQLERI